MKAIVPLSGGIDSAVALAHAVESKCELVCINVLDNTSSYSLRRCNSADLIAAYYKLTCTVICMGDAEEGYPFYHGVLLAALTSQAMQYGAEIIWSGIHAGDYDKSPDRKQSFLYKMDDVIKLGTDDKVRLIVPFAHTKRHEVVKQGIAMKVPLHLTWSCQKNFEVPCLDCDGCLSRVEAFKRADRVDPLHAQYF